MSTSQQTPSDKIQSNPSQQNPPPAPRVTYVQGGQSCHFCQYQGRMKSKEYLNWKGWVSCILLIPFLLCCLPCCSDCSYSQKVYCPNCLRTQYSI